MAQKQPVEPIFPQPVSRSLQPSGDRKNLAKSATRALDVMEYFAEIGRPLRAVDIARALRYHPSSTDQLLKTMVDSAYLMFEPQAKLYYPSPRLAHFGARLTSEYYGDDRLYGLMNALRVATREMITIGRLLGETMQLVQILGDSSHTSETFKGGRISMLESALGKACLAAHNDSFIERAVRRALGIERNNADFWATIDEIERVRRTGYAAGGAGREVDIWSIGIALPRTPSGHIFALGLGGATDRVRPREAELAEQMRREIGKWLG